MGTYRNFPCGMVPMKAAYDPKVIKILDSGAKQCGEFFRFCVDCEIPFVTPKEEVQHCHACSGKMKKYLHKKGGERGTFEVIPYRDYIKKLEEQNNGSKQISKRRYAKRGRPHKLADWSGEGSDEDIA